MKKTRIFTILSLIGLVTMLSCFSCSLHAAEKTNREAILGVEPEWQENYTSYMYNYQYLDVLKSKIGQDLRIDIYLGFWCSDSKLQVPHFIRILDDLSDEKITVNYYTVERKPNKEVKYFVEDTKVEKVPTFIFYRGDKEIGRIIENPQKSLIEDFLSIVF